MAIPEVLGTEPVHLSNLDREWLEGFTQYWPESDDSVWLNGLNDLLIQGGQNAKTHTPEKQAISAKRSEFFSHLPGITPKTLATFHGQTVRPNPGVFVESMRLLHSFGIDTVSLANGFPAVLGYTTANITEKLAVYEEAGVNVAKVINLHKTNIGYSVESVKEKMQFMEEMGFNVPFVLNTEPGSLGISPQYLVEKAEFFESKGLRLAVVANKYPGIMRIAPKKIDIKLRVMYAAARSWGWSDPINDVNSVIERYPHILSVKAAKLRTLIRIASNSLPSQPPERTLDSSIMNVVNSNLEGTLVAYLTQREEITHPRDLRRLSRRNRQMGMPVLRSIIAENGDDPVVKVYSRGYPLK